MRKPTRAVMRQIELVLPAWGGRRKGAGRKPKGARAGAPHGKRPAVGQRVPVHVTMRFMPHVWNLRSKRCWRIINDAFVALRARADVFRVTEFSVQGNHIHLLGEAASAMALARGMQSLSVRIAKGLNRLMGRRGQVFLERYRARLLTTAREVRNALSYVLNNDRRHAAQYGGALAGTARDVDWYSSGRWFNGWRRAGRPLAEGPEAMRPVAEGAEAMRPVAEARSWLLAVGWRKHGLLSREEVPARAATRRAA